MTQRELPPVGEKASVTHVFSQADIVEFARLSGDTNPVHLDTEAARVLGFPGTIVHGMLAAGLISRVLGTVLPGSGTIYLSQELRFRRPIAPGLTVVASVEVVSRRDDKPIFELATIVAVADEIAIEGNATVLVRIP
jgi:acyl dehydratase